MITPKSGRKEFKELGIILWMSLLTEIITVLGWYVLHLNVNLIGNIFNILNLPVAVLLYRHRINWKNKNTLAYLIVIPFMLFGVIDLFLIQGFLNFNSYTTSLAAVCFIVISLAYFYFLIQELPTESITRLPMFWINTANLIYYSGTFFLYLSFDYLVNVLKDNTIGTWLVHNFLGLIFYPILWYALLLIRSEYRRQSQ